MELRNYLQTSRHIQLRRSVTHTFSLALILDICNICSVLRIGDEGVIAIIGLSESATNVAH